MVKYALAGEVDTMGKTEDAHGLSRSAIFRRFQGFFVQNFVKSGPNK
jgi:hypothetical protein